MSESVNFGVYTAPTTAVGGTNPNDDLQTIIQELQQFQSEIEQLESIFPATKTAPNTTDYLEAVEQLQNKYFPAIQSLLTPDVKNLIDETCVKMGWSGTAPSYLASLRDLSDLTGDQPPYGSFSSRTYLQQFANLRQLDEATSLLINHMQTQGPNPPVVHPDDPSLIISAYQTEYNEFIEATRANPHDENAVQTFLNFLTANKDQLESAADQVGYDPFMDPVANPQGEIDTEMDTVITDLQNYDKLSSTDPLDEFAGDLGAWMGIGTSPEGVLNGLQGYAKDYMQTGNPMDAKMLKVLLTSPGYLKALGLFASNPNQFALDAQNAVANGLDAADLNKVLQDLGQK